MLRKLSQVLLLAPKHGANRYWEIDTLRGVAIVMMVVYHFVVDLSLFDFYQAEVFAGGWRSFASLTAGTFLLLMGGSLSLGYSRASPRYTKLDLFKRYLVRGLTLVGWGFVITLVMWLYFGRALVLFGILHLMGTATILAFPFLWLRWANLALGLLIVVAGRYLNQLQSSPPGLFWLGLGPVPFYQLDYYPILPWFGLTLLGLFLARLLYPAGSRRFELPPSNNWGAAKLLGGMGRRSLLIYLVHQPVLLVFLFLVRASGLVR
jgi:uncharacterized membrane protein